MSKTLVGIFCLVVASVGFAATPLSNVVLTGTGNSVQNSAIMTFQSGSTISVDSGATVIGLARTNASLTALAGITISSESLSLLPLTTRTAWFNAIAPATPAKGDILYFDATNWVDLPIGTTGQVLTVASALPSWAGSAAGAPSTSTYIIQTADVGLANAQVLGSLSTGLLKVATTTGILSTASAGTDYLAAGAVTTSGLTMTSARLLGRLTSSTGAIEELTFSGTLDQIGNTRGSILERGSSGWTVIPPGTSGWVLTSNGSSADPTYQSAGGGSGTVTSVSATVPTGFSISGSPITSSGTLGITYMSGQTANRFLATPDGTTGALGERAIVVGDFPTSGATAGTYGDATHVSQVSVDTAGRVTAASSVSITAGAPAGSDTYVQYNSSGSFAGVSNFIWDNSAQTLHVTRTANGPNFILNNPTSSSYSSFRAYNDVNSGARALELGYTGSSYPNPIMSNTAIGEGGYITTTGAYSMFIGSGNAAAIEVKSSLALRLYGYGAGALTTDSSGNVTAVSGYVTGAVVSGSAISLTTATGANVTSISLGAGTWDVSGNINFSASTATVTGTSGGITSTTATVPTDGTEVYSGVQVTLLSENDSVTIPSKRFTLGGTTTIYLVGKCTFSAGSVSAFGSITAKQAF